jgi:hypothetical protein
MNPFSQTQAVKSASTATHQHDKIPQLQDVATLVEKGTLHFFILVSYLSYAASPCNEM